MSNIKIDSRSGERLSFFQLFEQRYMQVETPIIQRDYAQGRIEVAEVRDTITWLFGKRSAFSGFGLRLW